MRTITGTPKNRVPVLFPHSHCSESFSNLIHIHKVHRHYCIYIIKVYITRTFSLVGKSFKTAKLLSQFFLYFFLLTWDIVVWTFHCKQCGVTIHIDFLKNSYYSRIDPSTQSELHRCKALIVTRRSFWITKCNKVKRKLIMHSDVILFAMKIWNEVKHLKLEESKWKTAYHILKL